MQFILNKFPRQLLLTLLTCSLFCLHSFVATAANIETHQIEHPVQIQSVEVIHTGDFTDYNDTKKTIPFANGQTTSLLEIASTLENLKKLAWIKSLNWHIEELPNQKINLKITIEEFRMVRGVSVKGNYPFLAKQITRLIPLQPGSVFDNNLLAPSILAIEEFLQKNGFYNSIATITSHEHKKFPTVDLHIRIQKGHTYRYGTIDIAGNTVFQQSRLANKISRSSRYQENRLKKDLRRIDRLYTKKGYIKSRVKVENKTFNEDQKTVDLQIVLRENKKLVLTFSGQKSASSSQLRKIVNLKDSRAYDRYAMEQGQERLERYYLKNGFPFAQIFPTLFKENETVYIDYEIQAGPRIELRQLSFGGNKKLSDKKIAKMIQSREAKLFSHGIYDESLLEKDKALVLQTYKEDGFLDVAISEAQVQSNDFGDQRTVTYLVTEGNQYEVSDVEFYGLPDDSLLFTQKLPLRNKKPFNHKRYKQTEEKILQNLFELGYAYANIQSEFVKDTSSSTVKVIYTIDAGPKTYVRHIIIKGDYKTHLSILKQNLEFKEGELFNYQKLLNSQLNLRRLGVFATVKAQALGFEEKQSQVDVLFEVQEDKSITTNFQLGYDNRNSIRGEVNFTKRNFLGLAKQIHTRLIGGLKFDRIETTFSAPRIFGADINLANQYFFEYEDAPIYNAYSYGSFVSSLKTFGTRWTLGVKDQITRSEVIESQSDVVALGNALFDNTLNEFRVFGYYDARDNFSDPQKGVYIYANNEINTELSNPDNNFDTVEIGINHHKKLLNRLTLNQSLRYGQIFSLTPASLVPFNELFFMGGSDTVRGFEEDSIDDSGGIVRFIYNAELHFRLTEGFKLATFFDAGVLQDNFNTITEDDIRESAGFGLRYFTPVGPIRLDYGFILDRQSAEPMSRLHFSFGYFF